MPKSEIQLQIEKGEFEFPRHVGPRDSDVVEIMAELEPHLKLVERDGFLWMRPLNESTFWRHYFIEDTIKGVRAGLQHGRDEKRFQELCEQD